MKRIVILVFLFLMITLASCNSQTDDVIESGPDIGIPSEEINTRILLTVPEGWNEFKTEGAINLDVEVISEEQIAFNNNYGARLFTYQDDEWIEIPNVMIYLTGIYVLSPAKGDFFKHGSVGVVPALENIDQPTDLRIYVIGRIYENGQMSDKQTAAFIDVSLKP